MALGGATKSILYICLDLFGEMNIDDELLKNRRNLSHASFIVNVNLWRRNGRKWAFKRL